MSERRSVEGPLPDGVVLEGQEHNPNPPEEVAANRALFEANQRQLQADRQQTLQVVEPLQAQVEAQYVDAQQDPAHQAFVAEQLAHSEHDPLHEHGGQGGISSDNELRTVSLNPEVNALPAPIPTQPSGTRTPGAEDLP